MVAPQSLFFAFVVLRLSSMGQTVHIVERPAFRREVALAGKDTNGVLGNAQPPLQMEGVVLHFACRGMFLRSAEYKSTRCRTK